MGVSALRRWRDSGRTPSNVDPVSSVAEDAAYQIRGILEGTPASERASLLRRRLWAYEQIVASWAVDPPSRLQRIALLEGLVTLRDEALAQNSPPRPPEAR